MCAERIFPNNVNVTSNINSTWKDNWESLDKYFNVFYCAILMHYIYLYITESGQNYLELESEFTNILLLILHSFLLDIYI